MDCWIDYLQEPDELLLVWQPPADVEDRLRWAVGRLKSYAGETFFSYLRDEEFQTLNLGRQEATLKRYGFSGYPAFDKMRQPDEGVWRDAVRTFSRRVPPRYRSDFGAYLEHHKVKDAAKLSPMGLLAVTEAHLPSDGFSLVDPLNPAATVVDFVFEIAGFRHRVGPTSGLRQGDMLTFVAEPDNKWDPTAIQIMSQDLCIGYVNRLQTTTVGKWLTTRDLQCCIARINGQSGVSRAYALARVRPKSDTN